MYAIIETGGKQYRAEPGGILQVETLHAEVGATVEIKPVRFIGGDPGTTIGKPVIQEAHVRATVVRNGRTRSLLVFKKKRRKNYRKSRGHRQGFTQIRIEEIVSG